MSQSPPAAASRAAHRPEPGSPLRIEANGIAEVAGKDGLHIAEKTAGAAGPRQNRVVATSASRASGVNVLFCWANMTSMGLPGISLGKAKSTVAMRREGHGEIEGYPADNEAASHSPKEQDGAAEAAPPFFKGLPDWGECQQMQQAFRHAGIDHRTGNRIVGKKKPVKRVVLYSYQSGLLNTLKSAACRRR